VKITVLVENKPASVDDLNQGATNVSGEHGLAILLEYNSKRVLFDTGASPLIKQNADAMNLGSLLKRLDAIILSHGHYDHTGGVLEILRYAKSDIAIRVGPGFFTSKVRQKRNNFKKIGTPFQRSEIEKLGAQIIEEPGPRQIMPGLFLVNPIKMQEKWERTEQALCIETSEGDIVPDPFDEEQVLCVRTSRGLVVVVGCAHRGLVNSINAAKEAANESRICAVFGGAHLRGASIERIQRTAEYVADLNPEIVALGHCTGDEAEAYFSEILGERFIPLRAGMSLILE